MVSLTYEQIDNDDLQIDGNPNAQGGQRIFPDKKDVNDTVDRRKIRVKAKYSGKTAGVRIYFRNLDVDDPSSNAAPIDDETTPNAGNDNNGNVDGTANTKAGLLSFPQGSSGCLRFSNGISCLTDADGISTVDFTVTQQPGDNFTVVAATDENYINAVILSTDGINLLDSSGLQIPATTQNINGCANSSVQACRADMLTVWRRLPIEIDSMGKVEGNSVTGHFLLNQTVNTGSRQTINLPPLTSLEVNRFENGRLIIQHRDLQLFQNEIYYLKIIDSNLQTNPPINANTTNTVTVVNNIKNFTVSPGDTFTLYDDDDFNDDDGTSLDGDDGNEDVIEPETTMMQSTDTSCSNSLDTACNSFAPAYIKPYYDLSGSNQNIPFSLNTPNTDRATIYNNYYNNRLNASANFWTVYLLGVYQHATDEDSDPDESAATYGEVDMLQGVGAFVYIELNRATEYEDLDNPLIRVPGIDDWRNRPVGNKYTTTHEIGHLLNGSHDDCDSTAPCGTSTNDAGLMAGSSYRIRRTFTDTTLSKMRNVIQP